MAFNKILGMPDHPARADKSAPTLSGPYARSDKSAPTLSGPYGLRRNNGDDAVAWNEHHLHPAKFIIDAVRIHFGKLYVISHDIANFMEWLFIFAPCVDLPDTVLVESLAPCWGAGFCCRVNAHAETPH